MESILTTFHVDWKLLIAQAINFGVVALVLWWFGFKPLAKLLEGRAEKIEKGLNDAKEAESRLSQAEAEAKNIILKARQEGDARLVAAAEAAAKIRADELTAAKAEVEKTIATGKLALLAEKEEILSSIRGEAAGLVVAASKQVLKDVGNKDVNEALAEKVIKSIS